MFKKRKGEGELVIVGIIAVVVGFFILNPIYFINSGEIGLIKRMGVVQEGTVGPGLHFKTPLIDSVITVNVRNQAVANGQNKMLSTAIRTKDNQKITINYDILYANPTKNATDLYVKYGGDVVSNYLFTYTQSVLSNIAGRYTASEIMHNREAIRLEIIDAVRLRAIDKDLNAPIAEIVDIPFTSIQYSAQYDAVLEQKQKAFEMAKKLEYDLQAAVLQAKIKVTTAQADATAFKIKGEALKSSPNLIELEKLKVQMKLAEQWDGKSVPQTVVTSDKNGYMFNMGGKTN